jgi:hypothetical protein
MKNHLAISKYLSLFFLLFIYRSSIAQTDVACLGPGMVDRANSVCQISIGGSNCTGVLLNNENRDRRGFVLTARHCLTSSNFDINLTPAEKATAENATFTFKFRRKDCGGTTNEVTKSYTGAIFRAANFFTDFALLEIHPDNLPLDPDLVYAGWSREQPSGDFVHIAHPNSNPQKHSRGHKATIQSYDPWKVTVAWDEGGTATGASGGPLFNSSSKVVGNLSYLENFGKLSEMWDNAISSEKQLKHWLSPSSDHWEMPMLKPLSFSDASPTLICNGTNYTANMPYVVPGENLTWSSTSNITIINSGYNFVNITANGPTAKGLGTVTATWEGKSFDLFLNVGKPDLDGGVKLNYWETANTLTIVAPNVMHTASLYPVGIGGLTGVSWNPNPIIGGAYGSTQYDFMLSPYQSLKFDPLTVSNQCGTSEKFIEFFALESFAAKTYPNPATNVVNFEFQRTDRIEILPDEIEIYSETKSAPELSIKIQEVLNRKEFKNNILSINIDKLKRGNYYIHFRKGKEVTKSKLLLL